MAREIKLDGGEITLLKALGLTGAQVHGKLLFESAQGMGEAEVLDTIHGLMAMGYVLASRVHVRTREEVEQALFRVNSSYARDLKDALNPRSARDDRRDERRRR